MRCCESLPPSNYENSDVFSQLFAYYENCWQNQLPAGVYSDGSLEESLAILQEKSLPVLKRPVMQLQELWHDHLPSSELAGLLSFFKKEVVLSSK